jgi:hypothetical protein
MRAGRKAIAAAVVGCFLVAAPCGASAAAATRTNGGPPVAKGTAASERELTTDAAGRFAALALACVHQEYPNKVSHVLASDTDAKPPRDLHPAFYGCYDWHSSVHGHWLLVRLARRGLDEATAARARAALAESLTPAHVALEVAYLRAPGRASYERPYGLAWLLQLDLELHEWTDEGPATPAGAAARDQRRAWLRALAPLVAAAREQLATWLPELAYPIRIGEHDQTAFAFGLILDWARGTGDAEMAALLERTSTRLYAADRNCPLAYEPSGQDFLSPCLAEADLLRRVMPPSQFAEWLAAFLPQLPRDGSAAWLPVGLVTDRADPKLAHLDGLNLSRAWMLEGIAVGLPSEDARQGALLAAAKAHRDAALPQVTGEHYEGGHWLGSFATYLVTQRGLAATAAP